MRLECELIESEQLAADVKERTRWDDRWGTITQRY